MNHAIVHNLKTYMAERGFSSRELALRSEVKPSFIYDILSGKSNNPSSVKLSKVAKTLQVNLHDLVEAHSARTQFEDNTSQNIFYHQPAMAVPFLRLRADHPSEVTECEHTAPLTHFDPAWLRRHTPSNLSDLRCFEMADDSMAPELNPRDIVMVDTSQTRPSPPGIFLLCDQFHLLVKRVEILLPGEHPRVRIACDNPRYSTLECPLGEVNIIGRVVWVSKWVA